MTTVLLIETDSSRIQWVSAIMTDYNLLIANSAKDAFSLLGRYPAISIIITQQFFEDQDLESLLSTVRRKNEKIRVIVVTTAKPTHKLQTELQTIGANAVLYKPFSPRQLLSLLKYFENRATTEYRLA